MTDARTPTLIEGVRLSVTTFTLVRLRPARVDRATAAVAMTLAPVVGFAIGGVTAAVLYVARDLWQRTSPNALVTSVVAMIALVACSGALHLDGLADTADGLYASGDRTRRLAVMQDPHVGAFAVVALVFVLLLQLGAISTAVIRGLGTTAVITGAVAGRLALLWSCSRGMPAARAEGLGAAVIGSVSRLTAAVMTAVSVAGLVVIGELHDHGGGSEAVRIVASVAGGLAAAALLDLAAVRRLGGLTGDVLGAAIEVATAVTLAGIVIHAPLLH